eukprot:COSAG06_NODE_2642_length_6517_cov_33.378778_4_plen_161_part_00
MPNNKHESKRHTHTHINAQKTHEAASGSFVGARRRLLSVRFEKQERTLAWPRCLRVEQNVTKQTPQQYEATTIHENANEATTFSRELAPRMDLIWLVLTDRCTGTLECKSCSCCCSRWCCTPDPSNLPLEAQTHARIHVYFISKTFNLTVKRLNVLNASS